MQNEPLNEAAGARSAVNPYLELLKQALTASLYDESAWQLVQSPGVLRRSYSRLRSLASRGGANWRALLAAANGRSTTVPGKVAAQIIYVKKHAYDAAKRDEGRDWPLFGYTMIGRKRLDNLQACVEDVLARGVPGDLIETGVWRGGATILMRAILKQKGVLDRTVWVADSFQGLPPPLDAQDGWDMSGVEQLAVSREQVTRNFARFGLLDAQVKFIEGWFADTLPTAPIEQLAVLRLDGDLYSSTRDALVALYPKVSAGGFVIVDDYGSWPACKRAVDDYVRENNIRADIKAVDYTGVYWQVERRP